MDNKISETLELMCDRRNPQDKKILLLAELVEHKCNALATSQKELHDSLKCTNAKLDNLTQLLERYEQTAKECPVFRDKESYEKVSFYIKNPKLTILILVGVLALLSGLFSSTITGLIKGLMAL